MWNRCFVLVCQNDPVIWYAPLMHPLPSFFPYEQNVCTRLLRPFFVLKCYDEGFFSLQKLLFRNWQWIGRKCIPYMGNLWSPLKYNSIWWSLFLFLPMNALLCSQKCAGEELLRAVQHHDAPWIGLTWLSADPISAVLLSIVSDVVSLTLNIQTVDIRHVLPAIGTLLSPSHCWNNVLMVILQCDYCLCRDKLLHVVFKRLT